jgi:hypothetical protein
MHSWTQLSVGPALSFFLEWDVNCLNLSVREQTKLVQVQPFLFVNHQVGVDWLYKKWSL